MSDVLSANGELYCSQYMQSALELVFIHTAYKKKSIGCFASRFSHVCNFANWSQVA